MNAAPVSALLAAALSVGSAFADSGDKVAAFKGLDIDGDGLVSKAEAAGHEEATVAFDRGDRDRDGKLSVAEYERYAGAKARAEARAEARAIARAKAKQTSTRKDN